MSNFKYYVYIMFNKRNGTVYVGVTNDIVRRVYEHKRNINPNSFTSKYGCHQLGYYEDWDDINSAIRREKQLKAGPRKNKVALIESINPDWKDLSVYSEFWM